MMNLLAIAISSAGMAASECSAAPSTIDPPVGAKFVYELDDPNTRGYQLAQKIVETRGGYTRILQSIIHRQRDEKHEIPEPEQKLVKFRGAFGVTAETPRYRHALRFSRTLADSLSGLRLGESTSVVADETLAISGQRPGQGSKVQQSKSKLHATFRGCFKENVAGQDDLVLKYDITVPSLRRAKNGELETFLLKASVAISQRWGWLAYEDGPAGRLTLVEVGQ